MNRRDFLLAGLGGGALAWAPLSKRDADSDSVVSLVVDPSDSVAASAPARWALDELRRSLSDAGVAVRQLEAIEQAGATDICVVATASTTPLATQALERAGVRRPDAAESLALVRAVVSGRRALVASAADTRGLVYALLELSDRIRHGAPIETSLLPNQPRAERPANRVRSVMRQYTSETLDKPWLYDREMWSSYLTMLATNRFNRFHLAFGLGYDSLRRVADSHLLFLYPFLVAVPGYDVWVTNVSGAERERTLEMLRFISDETVARGLEFQLGIWTHGYRLADSPHARYLVEGLTAATHAPYCRDALASVLDACPAISAVALRIHGESGIAEESYDFWSTVFSGVARSGRTIEIDLHAKGIDARMIEAALATGMPVNVSPKFWAEHLGMPYHQTAIRELEMAVPGRTGTGLMTLSEGSRSFTRYGYADLLRNDRAYTVRHRVFSGTQRLLLGGDPQWTAAYSRAFGFCDSTGVDLMEPLTCRGRRGTGVEPRLGYVERRLVPRWDWEKYAYWYRIWGRLTYDPETPPEVWRRELGSDPGAPHREAALAHASRILPIVTTAHLPSAACDAYWPEIYWNQSLVREPRANPYGDTPSPKTFQHVSPLDPRLFSEMSDFAAELLQDERSGKYSPVEVAQWLEDLSADALKELTASGRPRSQAAMRLAIDVELLAALGTFFGAKLRSGVLYAIHERTGSRHALEEALAAYRSARAAWASLVRRSKGIYAADLSVSDKISERGQWHDRLPAIDEDIALMAEGLASTANDDDPRVARAIAHVLGRPVREVMPVVHQPPVAFRPREAIAIELGVEGDRVISSARLYYRHVSQAERYESVAMARDGGTCRATIPASYTASPFPLQYYFALEAGPGMAWIHPGFDAGLASQPYYVITAEPASSKTPK